MSSSKQTHRKSDTDVKPTPPLTSAVRKSAQEKRDTREMIDKYTVNVALDDFLREFLRVTEIDVDSFFETLASDNYSLYDRDGQRWNGLPVEAPKRPRNIARVQKLARTPGNISRQSSRGASLDSSHQSSTRSSPDVSPLSTPTTVQSPTNTTEDLLERDMYRPFVSIANTIGSLVKSTVGDPTGQLNGIWVDCSSHTPASLGATEDRRPDMTFLSSKSEKSQLAENTKARYSGSNSRTENESLDKIWWSQIFTIAELKKRSQDKKAALVQLACYVRQLFKAQLDRRFALAMTLCGHIFNVYLFDRSGVVATDSINIHACPKKFISVLAAFAYLSPERLGWDPTMRVYLQPDNVMPSYEVPWKKLSELSKYDIQWVITHNEEEWVTLETLSIVHSDMLVGRATLVFRVVGWEDFKAANENADVYVIKQTWERLPGRANDCAKSLMNGPDDVKNQSIRQHPSPFNTKPFEAHVLEKAGLESERTHSYEYVRSGEDIVDTLHWIRRNVLIEVPGERVSSSVLEINSTTQSLENREKHLTPHYTSGFSGLTSVSNQYSGFNNLVCRTQTRHLLKDFGWPIKYFRNLKELLTVIIDAIKNRESLFQKRVLHRDISPGNILIRENSTTYDIRPQSDMSSAYDGLLIDFDHSKATERTRSLRVNDISDKGKEEIRLYVILRALDEVAFFHASVSGVDVEDTGLEIGAAMRARGLQPKKVSGIWTLEDLGWDTAPDTLPIFGDDGAGKGERTGTMEFMSHKLLLNDPPSHQAIHDIESFWWVLLYLSVAYEGPGAAPARKTQELLHCLHIYFEDSREHLGKIRVRLFDFDRKSSQEMLTDDLLSHVHPYFDPIKPLLEKWWSLLYCAFYHPRSLDFVYPYGPILKLLKNELNTISQESNTNVLEQMEDIRRIIHNATVKAAIRFKTSNALVDKPELTSQGIIFTDGSFPNNPYILEIPPALRKVEKELISKTIERMFPKDKVVRSRSSSDCDMDDKPKTKRTKN